VIVEEGSFFLRKGERDGDRASCGRMLQLGEGGGKTSSTLSQRKRASFLTEKERITDLGLYPVPLTRQLKGGKGDPLLSVKRRGNFPSHSDRGGRERTTLSLTLRKIDEQVWGH